MILFSLILRVSYMKAKDAAETQKGHRVVNLCAPSASRRGIDFSLH